MLGCQKKEEARETKGLNTTILLWATKPGGEHFGSGQNKATFQVVFLGLVELK